MGGTEMSSPDPHKPTDNPDVVHEESDINVRAIIWFVIVLTGITLAVDVAMWGMFKGLEWYEVKNDPPVSPLSMPAAGPNGGPMPAPGLQTEPWKDLKEFRAAQNAYLHGYGWIDEHAGVARVPIGKAKELLLKQGLPVRPELADALEGTNVAAGGESNGGRTLPGGQPDKSSPVAPPAAAPAVPTAPTKPGGGGHD